MLAGQALRAIAMIQASTNFSHMVAHNKVEGHRLVKEGVYSYVPPLRFCDMCADTRSQVV